MSRISQGRIFKRKKNGKETGNYQLQYYIKGVEKRVSLGTGDLKQAEKRRDDILRPLQATTKTKRLQEVYHTLKDSERESETLLFEKQGAIPLDMVWKRIINHDTFKETKESTLREYRLQWTAFIEWVKKHYPKAKTISRITPEMAIAYMETKKNRNRGTQNKIIRCCSRVFKLIYDTEDKAYNPFSGISTYSGRKVKQEQHKPLTWDKAMELCDKAPDKETRLLFFLGLYTGQRLGDCVLLSWSEVDLLRNLIMLTQRKTGREVTIPIHANLRPLFEETPTSDRKGYVLPGLAYIYTNRHPAHVTRKIKAVFDACGISAYKDGTGPGTGKRAVVQYSFHSLRHTFNTRLRENGVGDAVIQALTGHTTQAMTDRYTAIGGDVIESAIKQLPALNDSGTDTSADQSERAELKRLIDTMPIEQVRAVKLFIQKSMSGFEIGTRPPHSS